MDFNTWCKEVEKLKEESFTKYIGLLKNNLAELMNLNLPVPLLQIVDIEEFKTIEKTIMDDPKFKELNEKRHRELSSALNCYERYLLNINMASVIEKAATFLKDIIQKEEYTIPTVSTDIETALQHFSERFSPEKLEALDDDDLLPYIFYTRGDNTNALCCWLEMNKESRFFGSISGGSVYKFGLSQRKDGVWVKGGSKNPTELTEEEALKFGKTIRDALVKGANIIRNASLNTLAEYENLDDTLNIELGKQICNWSWVHKYFSMVCHDKLSGFHSDEWQLHVLRSLQVQPSKKRYARSGQIAMIQNINKWYYQQFIDVFTMWFGNPIHFIRLGCTDDDNIYAQEWYQRGIVGIGWAKLGDLNQYVVKNGIDRVKVQETLYKLYYPDDKRTASRKAGEISLFYDCNPENTVFVIMKGLQLIAFADDLGSYEYDDTSPMAHKRKASWKISFKDGETLPNYSKGAGKQTSCYQLTDDENLFYLYKKYFYGEEVKNTWIQGEKNDDPPPLKQIKFHTGYSSDFERNRIIFGAPGTGKSYKLNQQARQLIGKDNEIDYERVTFHPDYSYSHFVGTYKPVPKDGDSGITYEYVPGPFMRVYVNALKNSKTESIKPFLLIIEEINRANAAAVFGDIFQLLDRDDDNVSIYPIQASEDIKKHLAKELNGKPEDFSKICIPDNMFIWATMNSADQGVFPLDTAFKRRWEFTYLGIDDSDNDICGKYVLLAKDKTQKVEWNKLRKAINDFLAKEKINEDKQLGPYFISRKTVVPEEGDEINREKFIETFKNKVLMYLFEDAVKHKRAKLFLGFSESDLRYSKVCEKFYEIGIEIFNTDTQNKLGFEKIIKAEK